MIALALAFASLQATPPVSSPTVSMAAPADAARLASATQLMETLRIERTLDAMFLQLSPIFAQSVIGMMATNTDIKGVIDKLVTAAPENRDRIVAILSQEFLTSVKRQYPAFKQKMAQEYADAFTLDELTAINAFYSSGPGAKALAIMPQLQVRMTAAGRELGRIAGEEAGRRGFERIANEMMPEKKKPVT